MERVKDAPDFWNERDRRGMRCISGNNLFDKCSDLVPMYASDCFAWEMWNHRPPQGPSLHQFRKFVEYVLPGYNEATAPRYPVEDLLKTFAGNADVAFLTAAWYYSSMLPGKIFPCGHRQWPPQGFGAVVTSSPASASSASSGG